MSKLFLQSVLGARGAKILEELCKDEGVGAFVTYRTILGWLQSVDSISSLPGLSGTFAILTKSDAVFNGSIDFDGLEYPVNQASLNETAALVGARLGVSLNKCDSRDVDLARLGKTIDLLIKAQYRPNRVTHDAPEIGGRAEHIEHIEPEAPVPANQTPKKPKLPRLKRQSLPKFSQSVSITKSESEIKCRVCEEPQFHNDEFRGCYCLRGMSKPLVKSQPMGYQLTLIDWDNDDITILMEALNRVK